MLGSFSFRGFRSETIYKRKTNKCENLLLTSFVSKHHGLLVCYRSANGKLGTTGVFPH